MVVVYLVFTGYKLKNVCLTKTSMMLTTSYRHPDLNDIFLKIILKRHWNVTLVIYQLHIKIMLKYCG